MDEVARPLPRNRGFETASRPLVGATLVMSAALSLVGVVLEVEFGQPISIDSIVAGLVRSQSAATSGPSWHAERHHPS